uniref:Uncharacterized protein MANES_10G041500 n=1 Tax=Rhizophora mucronata TaxID=61149 RepID=A0A2P2K5H4_RHIMU
MEKLLKMPRILSRNVSLSSSALSPARQVISVKRRRGRLSMGMIYCGQWRH